MVIQKPMRIGKYIKLRKAENAFHIMLTGLMIISNRMKL